MRGSHSFGRAPGSAGNAKVTSALTGIVDGSGSLGAAIQGPLVGALNTSLGWDWVFYVLIGMSCFSGLMLFQPVMEEAKDNAITFG